jgi:hypothetical protein
MIKMDPFLELFLINISSGPVRLAQVSIFPSTEAISYSFKASSAIIIRVQMSWLEGLWNSHCETAVGISAELLILI